MTSATLAIDYLFHRPAILYGLYSMFPFTLKASRLKNVKFADIEVYMKQRGKIEIEAQLLIKTTVTFDHDRFRFKLNHLS